MEMDEKKQAVPEVTLLPYLKAILKQLPRLWWLLLLLILLGASAFAFRGYKAYIPSYTTTATFAASTGIGGVTDISTVSSYYDSQLCSEIMTTFPYIMATEAMQERIKADLQVELFTGTVTAERIGDTCYFKIISTAPDEKTSQQVLDSVARNYPEVASVVIGSAELSQIEEPRTEYHGLSASDLVGQAAKGGSIGLVLGVLILGLTALRRKSVESSEDMKAVTKLTCCGNVPRIQLKKRRNDSSALISLMNPRMDRQLEPAITELRTKVLRALRINAESTGKLLMITSTCAGEGKTTVAVNLAISLAQSGRNVLLVDADLRNQSIRSRFGSVDFGASTGLLEALQQPELILADHIVQVENLPLWIFAGEQTEAAPLSLLTGRRMKEILAELKKMADIVIIDSPPAGVLADAAAIGRLMDDTMYVVRSGGVPAYQIRDVLRDLEKHHVHLTGYILNGASSGTVSEANGNYSRYGKYGHYGKYGKYGSYSYYSDSKKRKQRKTE